MTEKTFYRSADIDKGEAVKSLLEANPGATIVRVDTKRATPSEARFASVRTGTEIYAATIRVAEDDDSSDDKPSDDSSGDGGEKKNPFADKGDGGSDDGGSDDKGSDDKGGDALDLTGDGDGDGGDKPEKLTGDAGIIDLLQQLVDAVKGGASLGAPDDGALPGDDLGPVGGDLPPGGDASVLPDAPTADVGAPVPGTPLPPPVKPKPGPGGPAFASVQSRVASSGTAELVLRDVTSAVKTKDILDQAAKDFPDHKVAKVRRNGTEKIKGVEVNLPANEIALVTLVRK